MSNYLGANVPEKEKQAQKQTSGRENDRFKQLENELAAIKEQLAIQNRDNLDAMYNIGMDNLDDNMKRLISETGNSIASIIVKTNENSASIKAFAEWKNGTGTDSLAGFVANATKDFATISMLASYTTTTDVNNLISSATAGIIAEAQEGMATVSMIASVTDSDGDVTAASIVTAVNKSSSSVKINANHVDITGFVTFSDLETKGASTINGNNISLISDRYGDSESSITFKKKIGTGDSTEDFFKLYTIDNREENDDEARFAVKLEAFRVQATDGYKYGTALKLIGSSISIEPSQTFFVSSLYATIDAARNLGVRAYKTGTQLENLLPNGKVADTYYFCTDGIYYGDAKILST